MTLMNYQLKTVLSKVMNLCEPFDDELDLGMSTKEIIRVDLVKYILYLSAADNVLSSQEVEVLRDYLEWDMTVSQWCEFIKQNNLAGDDFVNNIPISLQIFVRVDNQAYQRDSSISDICDLYESMFDTIGKLVISADGEIQDNEKTRFQRVIGMIEKYVNENALRRKNLGECSSVIINEPEEVISEKYFRCPSCGKISVNNGEFCVNCYERIKNLSLTRQNFIKPLSEKVFYNPRDKKDYLKVVFLTENSGLVLRSTEKNGEYIEDYYSDPFIKRGNSIVIQDEDFPREYEISDWYLKNTTKGYSYKGNIPNGNFFETYCETGTFMFMEYWFTNTGDVYMFDPSKSNELTADALHPVGKGKYVRDGDVIRMEIKDFKSGQTKKTSAFVINGRYCPGVYVVEDKFDFYNKEMDKPINVSNPIVAPAEITEREFFENYPCPYCNARQAWQKKEWNYYASGNISIYAQCKLCGGTAQEIEDAPTIRKIAYNGSKPNPYYHPTAGSIRYLDNPCPYCHSYQVRYIKWKDKRASVYFWGRLSSKIGTHYICDNCKKTWE